MTRTEWLTLRNVIQATIQSDETGEGIISKYSQRLWNSVLIQNCPTSSTNVAQAPSSLHSESWLDIAVCSSCCEVGTISYWILLFNPWLLLVMLQKLLTHL